MESVVERVLNAYGLSYDVCLPVQKGYRNSSYAVELTDGSRANLILYKTEPDILPRIKRANAVSDFLVTQGLPARRTLSDKIVKLQAGDYVKYGALYNYLPGATIPWEAYTKDHIKLAGMAMSTMHARLRQADVALPKVTDEYAAIVARMQDYFSQPPVRQAMAEKLQVAVRPAAMPHYRKVLERCEALPDQQALHMDFVRGNLLFQTATFDDVFVINDLALSGVLDFEKVSCGHPVFDIARTLAFLLVDCKFKSPEKVRKYFLHSGYAKRGEARLPGYLHLLEQLVTLFLVYDFYKFLRHNPYESLHANQHYLRTKDMLLARNVIR